MGFNLPLLLRRRRSGARITYVLFIPSGSARMLTSTGDVFKVREA